MIQAVSYDPGVIDLRISVPGLPIGVLLPQCSMTLEEWFVQCYLPLLCPERVKAIMAKLTARRLGGNQPGPLTPPSA